MAVGPPYTSFAVANAFIKLARRDKNPISPMKVQKLIYYAHGWHLAIMGRPLIDEPIEAWEYGPVVSTVYHEFKRYGSKSIEEFGYELEGTVIRVPGVPLSDNVTRQLLEKIWGVYGDFTAVQLSNMSHGQDSPWQKTRQEAKNALSEEISNDLIREHFIKIGKRNSQQ